MAPSAGSVEEALRLVEERLRAMGAGDARGSSGSGLGAARARVAAALLGGGPPKRPCRHQH